MDFQLIGRRFWWLLAMSIIKESTCLKGPWLKVPHMVKAGDSVTLSCEYDAENVALYSVKWYRNNHEFFRYTPNDYPELKYFPIRNNIVDMERSGPTQVTLKNVTKEGSGRYECEVSTDAPLFQTEIQNATMIVIDEPTRYPSLKVNHESLTIGTTLVAECFVPASDPPANITWSINKQRVPTNNATVPEASQQNVENHLVSRKIEIETDSSDFIDGVLSLKCEANMFDIWSRGVEIKVREVIPANLMAELAVSSTTSQQTQIQDPDSDFLYNSSNSSLIFFSFNAFLAMQFLCYVF